ncbi:MAG: RNA 3'-terminal phosphate cyclase [Nanoarchaeota archaeon]
MDSQRTFDSGKDSVEVDFFKQECTGGCVRNAILASALSETPVVLKNICFEKENPGLSQPMVEYVKLIAGFCSAEVSGLGVGSQTLSFSPKKQVSLPKTISLELGGSHSVVLYGLPVMIMALYQSSLITIKVMGRTHGNHAPPADVFNEQIVKYLHPFTFVLQTAVRKSAFYSDADGLLLMKIHGKHFLDDHVPAFSPEQKQNLAAIKINILANSELASDTRMERYESLLELSFKKYDVPVLIDVNYTRTSSKGIAISVHALFGDDDGFDNDLAWVHSVDRFCDKQDILDENVEKSIASMVKELSLRIDSDAIDLNVAEQLLPMLALHGGQIIVEEFTSRLQSYCAVFERILSITFSYEERRLSCDGFAKQISAEITELDDL